MHSHEIQELCNRIVEQIWNDAPIPKCQLPPFRRYHLAKIGYRNHVPPGGLERRVISPTGSPADWRPEPRLMLPARAGIGDG